MDPLHEKKLAQRQDTAVAAGPSAAGAKPSAIKAGLRSMNYEEGRRALSLRDGATAGAGGKSMPVPGETPAGTLWAKDASGKDLPPSVVDISQGGLNDCFLMAAMAAIVNADPSAITKMIADNGDGTYTVTFKGVSTGFLGLGGPATVTVNLKFEVGKHANVASRRALWPLVIEKAYGEMKGKGTKTFDKGGNPGNAVDAMTGKGASPFDPRDKSEDEILAAFLAAKEKRRPATLLAPEKKDADATKKAMVARISGLYFWHAYAVIDVSKDKAALKLFNPWGRDHPNGDGWLPVADVKKFFIQANINE